MCVASCVPCHASKGLRHGATTHECSLWHWHHTQEFHNMFKLTLRNMDLPYCNRCIGPCMRHAVIWTSQCGLHLWLHPLVRPHYTCSCRTLISTMVSKSCPEVRFWGLLVLELPHASKTCLLAALLTCVLVCVRLVLACPSMYAHQHTARMATTSLD